MKNHQNNGRARKLDKAAEHTSEEFKAEDWLRELVPFLEPAAALEQVFGAPPDAWQVEVTTTEAEFILLLASRGIGKSTTCAFGAHLFAEANPKTTTLIIAPAQRQADELFRNVEIAREALSLSQPLKRDNVTMVEYQNGSRIICLPASEKTIRSYRAHRIYLDEAARITDEDFAAIVPMLLESGQLFCMTTPNGRENEFARAWLGGRGHQIMARSIDLPRMKKIVERDKGILAPAKFRQEHLLSFVASGTDIFFEYDQLEKAFDKSIPSIELRCL
ncbi:MAG: hypothetical protein HKP56_00495 [Anderseniella sp.]|nr:hypothetical protein [Anderseniella sp.]